MRATILNYAGLLIGTGFALLWVINRGLYRSLEAGIWVVGIIALVIGLALMFGTRWIGLLANRLPATAAEHARTANRQPYPRSSLAIVALDPAGARDAWRCSS